MTGIAPRPVAAPPASGRELRARLAAAAAAALALPPEAIDLTTPLWQYGLDSLGAAELTAAVEDALGVELPLSLFVEHPDVESVARHLERRLGGPAGPAAAAAARLDRMLADSVLGPEVVPGASRPTATGRVLLTGATGFLGAYLVRALLRESDAAVLCLVRGGGEAECLTRVRRNLERYGLWGQDVAARLRVVPGDVARPRLGLTPERFAALAEAVDAVYHAAAGVNWVAPYESLRAANVEGTRELLRLACAGAAKPFHFVSSLSVCYATTGPREVREHDDVLERLGGLHLGYAQSKCVGEALVRQAAARGLPATIHRPSLVAGDSRTGASNGDDLIAALLRGCIAMRAAPDLDWLMDCVPADHAAESIVRLSRTGETDGGGGGALRVFHLANPRARHWRECVLWMRLAGYPLRLLPYDEWARRVEAAARDASHPLHALRPFLLTRQRAAGSLTLPELYEEGRRAHAACDHTRRALAAADLDCPPLDARLLDRIFAHYVAAGHLPPAGRRWARGARAADAGSVDAAAGRLAPIVQRALRERLARPTLRVARLAAQRLGGDDSIVAELTSWRHRRTAGLFRCAVTLDDGGRRQRTLGVVVKLKPRDAHVIEVGECVARLCGDRVGDAYARFRDRVGFTRGHLREPAVYAQEDDRFRRHTPALLGSVHDGRRGVWAIVLEDVTDAVPTSAAGSGDAGWGRAHVETALRGLAELHGIWYGRERELLARPWLPPVRTAEGMAEMRELWDALAEHARPAFTAWAGASVGGIQARCVERVGEWWRLLEAAPRTLLHNDFNPRNIVVRPGGAGGLRLCAYDWELATAGAPQRDVAELLCHVLTPSATREEVEHYLAVHRRALEQTTGGAPAAADAELWRAGFAAALADLLIDRLSMYALVHRLRPQHFLPRVVCTWRTLAALYPLPSA